jgi:hypothetical protein
MNSREKEKEKKLFYLFLLINNKNTELYEMILKKNVELEGLVDI